jgi:hypothetical protein
MVVAVCLLKMFISNALVIFCGVFFRRLCDSLNSLSTRVAELRSKKLNFGLSST